MSLLPVRAVEETSRILAGGSPGAARLRDQIERVARTPRTTVLITGERGLALERVARAIHDRSALSAGPFRVVDCLSLLGNRSLRSSLDADGPFSTAPGGSLYLNEVWLRNPSPESFREFIGVFGTLRGEADKIGLTDDMFRLVAGPWLSIEEAKVIFIFDAPDATTTLPAFGGLLAKGLLSKRRLTPMVDWDEAAKFVEGL